MPTEFGQQGLAPDLGALPTALSHRHQASFPWLCYCSHSSKPLGFSSPSVLATW